MSGIRQQRFAVFKTRYKKIETSSDIAFQKFGNELNEWWPKEYTWLQEKLKEIITNEKKTDFVWKLGRMITIEDMLKKILIGLGIAVGLVVLTGAFGMYYFLPSEDKVLDFIKSNPDKSAILVMRNDMTFAEQNIDKVMPLASTVKIIVAIEYAEQSANGQLNPDELVQISDLDKFYIPNTDGGAHPSWLKSVRDKITEDKISIREIAKGMIKFSSNANTEWLLNELGIEKVNNRVDSLGLKNHTEIYNVVSALFVGKEKFPGLKGKELQKKLIGLSQSEYITATKDIHQKLFADTLYKKDIGELGMDIQKIWSDRLPASTVAEYVSVMKKINSRTYFSETSQKYLDEVMEFILENPANKKWLEHSGMKGGSTAFVLTKALYATDKKGNKTELAYFFNNLSALEKAKLQLSMNEFELKILTNQEFRETVKTELTE
ncbi:MAG: serine hydrolase [Tangfeifania sp.]